MMRFLSRREKDGSSHKRDKSRDKSGDKLADKKVRPRSGDGILSLFKNEKEDPQKKADNEQSNKLNMIRSRLAEKGYTRIEDEQISYALGTQYADGDVEKALEMVLLFQDSVEGIIKPYNSEINMLGAENREMVTCYIDSLLFAMFGRLSSFEPILCTSFDDEPRRRLSTLIRLWVNMLRDGKLIKKDITQHIQDALAASGWKDAARLEQQDVSEAFCFITEKLELPLLTLKVDIYHNGGADTDDHRFVQERLLSVGVPEEGPTDRPIRLEDCLESYFNNRIEVKRYLERTNTISSVKSGHSYSDEKMGSSQHVEVTIKDLPWSTPDTPTSTNSPSTPVSPGGSRGRAVSIVRRVGEEGRETTDSDASTIHAPRRVSNPQRKEILMPAWQFFNLIPWYTKSAQSTEDNAGITTHLSQTSPVLGICLKRYGWKENGESYRKNTFIDIPLDIRLPHFIDDTFIPENRPQMANFKLSLQSVICHRGNSLQSGHYISFIRGTMPIPDGDSQSTRRLSNTSRPPHYSEERWIKFDDLAEPRVSYVDIEKAMKDEMPYLLFYQVQPTTNTSTFDAPESEPPSYADSAAQSTTDVNAENQPPKTQGYFDGAKEDSTPTIRLSTEIDRSSSPPRRSINLPEDRRGSLAFTETSLTSGASSIQVTSAPVTPNEETAAQRMSRAAARFTGKSGSKSRPSSQSGESRISGAFSRLNLMRSKDNLNKRDPPPEEPKEPLPVPKGEVSEPRVSITIEEPARPSEQQLGLTTEEPTIERSKSKREKKRSKSKGPSSEKSDENNHERHHSHHKEKGKGRSKEDSDRECRLM